MTAIAITNSETPGRSIGGMVFDATFKESHDLGLQVTDNPVESGVVISDHAFMLPFHLTIHAGVSDSPLAVTSSDQFSGNKRSIQAFELITALQKSAEPFDVQTGLKLYKNMVCTSIHVMQDKETSGALIFSADLRQVIIVETEKVKYKSRKVQSTESSPNAQQSSSGVSGKGKTFSDKQAVPRAGATARQAEPVVDRGKVAGNEVTSTARKSSVLKKILSL